MKPSGMSPSFSRHLAPLLLLLLIQAHVLVGNILTAGHVYYQIKNGTVPPLPNSTISYHQHATLDPDGIIRVYTRPKNATGGKSNVSWAVTGIIPSEGCSTSTNYQSLCGPNSYCINGPNDRLDCKCPRGYSFLDEQLKYKGCTQGFVPQSCHGNHSAEFGIHKMPNTIWRFAAYERYSYTTEDQCGDFCLIDCQCTAALFDGTYCGKLAMLTGAGHQGENVTMKALIKVRTSSPLGLVSPRTSRTEVLFHSNDDAIEDLVRVERFLRVALWCIEQNPSLRPTMHQVVQMLEGVVEVDTLPAPTSSNYSSPSTSSIDEGSTLLLSGAATLEIE